MKRINLTILFLTVCVSFFAYTETSFAKTDLSISDSDITFSKSEIFSGDTVRIYARVFNAGDNDVLGHVVFLNGNKKIADPQIVSLKPNTYDDVFIDWKPTAGTYNIEAKIMEVNPKDDNLGNNETTKTNVFVDKDTDGDNIGDNEDADIDGDGLTNDEEKTAGTNPLIIDSDSDKVNDKIDAFPLDKTEWHDTNNNNIGDNKDPDADGDGLLNLDEIQNYGTNPLNSDSDSDNVPDKQEVDNGTNPNLAENSSTSPDNQLFGDIGSASLMSSLTGLFKGEKAPYFIVGIPLSLMVLLLLFRKKKDKKSRK